MSEGQDVDVEDLTRAALLDALFEKVQDDTYPSSTMLDMIETLLTPQDVPRYADLLLEGVRESRFPSIPILQRLQALAGAD